MSKIWPATDLTGGGFGAIDAIDGDLLGDEDGAIVIDPGTKIFYHYTLDADYSGPVSFPDQIPPAINPGTKMWILIPGPARNINFISFNINPTGVPTDEGTLSWNHEDYTANLYTGLGPVLQVGQETYILVYNDTGIEIPNGTPVSPVGQINGRPSVAPCHSDTHETIARPIYVTTMLLPLDDGEGGPALGIATSSGYVRGIDTTPYILGTEVWIAPEGGLTSTEPEFPNYPIRIGGVTKSGELDGEIFVQLGGTVNDTLSNFHNGTFRESFDFRVISSGTVITGVLTPSNGHPDMTMMFSDGFTMLDTDPSATIVLTPGTDTNPQENFVYIPKSTKVLTVSTSDWPTTEHIRIADVYVQSAAGVLDQGAAKNRNWNDHVMSTSNNQGHLAHMGQRFRSLSSDWDSGVEATLTGTPTNGYIATTAGKAFQQHLQTMPATEMPTDAIHIINDPTTPFKPVTNLNTITEDSEGNSLNNKYFSIVVWAICNKTGEESHLVCNLPSGGYTVSEATAIADAAAYTNYTIPKVFKGVAFLVARFTMKLSGGGFTYSAVTGYQDLRGFIPNSTAGAGAGSSGITTFLGLVDTPSSYVGQALKRPQVNAGETAIEFVNGFNTQNLGTILSAKTINATDFSTITGDFTASFTATFEGFTASRKSVLLHLVVSGGGAPTITIAGYTFKFMTTANLTSMADGTYQVVVNNPKTDGNAFVYVKLAP
jgi:hypothetical protein